MPGTFFCICLGPKQDSLTVIVEEALTHQVVKGKRKAKSARVNDAMNIFLVTYTIRHMFLHCHHDPQSEGSHTLSGRDTLAG